ncbi:MAG: pentapeptide repeat-containing protein, partial [Myxococcota bacterium]|nr:pentapeptide repeat-containing protein [Myxococcota bacterium]
MWTRELRAGAVCILPLLFACSEIAATNPYDPNTPIAQQAKGRVSGQLVLPEGYRSAMTFEDVEIQLVPAATGPTTALKVGVNGRGEFTFDRVPAATYQLTSRVSGFEPVNLLVTVSRGQSRRLDAIELSPVDLTGQANRQWITGRVQLTGRRQNAHGNVEVSTLGGPYFTRTTDEGLFELEVPPNTYTLRFNHPDFGELRFPGVLVTAGRDTDVGEHVLAPFSGELTVTVSVQPSWLPIEERFGSVSLERVTDGYGIRNLQLDHQTPEVLGSIPSGTYRITVERAGFQTTAVDNVVFDDEQRTQAVDLEINLLDLADARINFEGQLINACDLRQGQVNLRRADLSGTELNGVFGEIETGSCVPSCDEQPCRPIDCAIDTCAPLDLTRARLTNVDFTAGEGANLANANLSAADLFGAKLAGIDLTSTKLSQANLFGAQAPGARLTGADLSGANLSAANLHGAILGTASGETRHPLTIDADESGAETEMTRPHPWAGRFVPASPLYRSPCSPDADHVRYRAPNSNGAPMPEANLDRAVLSQANLSEAFLAGLDLSTAVLNGVRLVDTDLRGTCLKGLNLSLLDLTDASFDGADLQGARLAGSVIFRSQFRGANLRGASLASSSIELADFGPWRAIAPDDPCAALTIENSQITDCDETPEDAMCTCKTQMDGTDFSGSLIQGSRFDYANLSDALFNETVLSESIAPSRSQSTWCQPNIMEAAYRF